jgi:excisionase family DNA binding protein
MSTPKSDQLERPRYISVAEAARLISLSEDTIRRRMDAGDLAKHRFGRRVLVDRLHLEAVLLASTAG